MQINPGPAHTLGGRDLPGRPERNGLRGARARAHGRVRPTPAPPRFSCSPPAMASVVSLAGAVGLLLMSALPEVLGDRSSPDRPAHPGTTEVC